jgi:hypothetical protein
MSAREAVAWVVMHAEMLARRARGDDLAALLILVRYDLYLWTTSQKHGRWLCEAVEQFVARGAS